tara:strand:- start:1640 stop:2230 length:591 start_codon:yes stop_codon:yes gene_type:complete
MSKVILSLCDYSGRWSQPYRDAGYEVIQVDIKLGFDVRLFPKLNKKVHGILMAPPCTEFAVSGARHWRGKAKHTPEKLTNNIGVVDACLRTVVIYSPKWWCLENPVGRMKNWYGVREYAFHPNEFAGWLPVGEREEEQYTKYTLLWGKFSKPKKKSLPPVLGSKMHTMYGGKSERTKEMRSQTPRGFAQAFFEANK